MVQLSRKLASFLKMTSRQRLLMLEAASLLGVSRFALLVLPFARIEPWLRRRPDAGPVDTATVLAVRQAVTVAARNVPWSAVCLPQAMAAKAMLARRGQGSVLHLGATMVDGRLNAHAWLAAGGEIVVGEAGLPEMTPLTRFG